MTETQFETEIKGTQDKCSSCGGHLYFSPEDQSLKCESCGGLEKIVFDHNNEKHNYEVNSEIKEEHKKFAEENKVFKCSSCGANVVLNKLDIATRCPYCDSSIAIAEDVEIGLRPDSIIPFKFGAEKASKLYKDGLKKKWFLPSIFKKSPPMDEIKGVYVPCFSFDAKSHTVYRGRLGRNHTTTSRNGHTRTHTTYFSISGARDFEHHDILVETSSHIDQIVFNGIKPYNLKELVVYNDAFIRGYSLEHYDQALENCKKVANSIMEQTIRNQILSSYTYSFVESYSQNVSLSEEKYSYYIVPTYSVKYKYKGKDYLTYMNGQTGKVGGGLPKSPVKITFFVLMLIAILAGIILLFYYF